MAADERPSGGAVIVDRLIERPQGFDLFQAISLLERAAPDAAPVGHSHRPHEREAVRLSALVSLGFEPSDVHGVGGPAASGEPYSLSTPALSLAGAGAPLPLAFAELLLERKARRDHATADFLDIFHHRFLAFLYRSRRKHHVALNARALASSPLAVTLDAASALGLRAGVRAPDGSAMWLRHAGLVGGAPRSMTALLALLRDRLQVQVQGRQFEGGWRVLEPDAHSRLASGRSAAGPRLGGTAVIGKRVWDQGAGVRLSFSGLDRARLMRLLPGGADHALMHWLVRRFVAQDLDIKVDLRLAPKQVASSRLAAANPMRLGWTAWLVGPAHRAQLPSVQLKLAAATAAGT
ncbi:MAG: type VI secretion system baseplate subunit TssG [Comamonadaceae bacterium]|nr:MAG: type VI secretion system baseplate subunit TssG [Comamonadaceae bacterium]